MIYIKPMQPVLKLLQHICRLQHPFYNRHLSLHRLARQRGNHWVLVTVSGDSGVRCDCSLNNSSDHSFPSSATLRANENDVYGFYLVQFPSQSLITPPLIKKNTSQLLWFSTVADNKYEYAFYLIWKAAQHVTEPLCPVTLNSKYEPWLN